MCVGLVLIMVAVCSKFVFRLLLGRCCFKYVCRFCVWSLLLLLSVLSLCFGCCLAVVASNMCGVSVFGLDYGCCLLYVCVSVVAWPLLLQVCVEFLCLVLIMVAVCSMFVFRLLLGRCCFKYVWSFRVWSSGCPLLV